MRWEFFFSLQRILIPNIVMVQVTVTKGLAVGFSVALAMSRIGCRMQIQVADVQ